MLNEKKFRAIYGEFLESGLTIRDYCANQQMNEARFYYWQNKLKGHLPPKRGFVPVIFENERQASQIPAHVQDLPGTHSHPAVSICWLNCVFPWGCLRRNSFWTKPLQHSREA